MTDETTNTEEVSSEIQSANATQVGGKHYKKATIQIWDYYIYNELGPLESNIVKYVCRYRDKNGIEDLEKAAHYLDKAFETATASHSATRKLHNVALPMNKLRISLADFARAQSLTNEETDIVRIATGWQTPKDLKAARDMVQFLIDNYDNPDLRASLVTDSSTGEAELVTVDQTSASRINSLDEATDNEE